MAVKKLTTLLVVEAIEPQLRSFESLGYRVTTRVPDSGPAGFVILQGPAGELMLQTRESLADDLPDVAKRRPSALLYAHVASLDEIKRGLPDAKVIVAQRETFYGANESGLARPGGVVLGLAQFDSKV